MLSPILITRPKGQQDSLATAITNAGAQTIHYPVMAIHALNEQQHATIIHRTAQQFAQLEQYQHVIFISSNAVRFAQRWLSAWPRQIHCYAIGTTTAAALSKQGIRCATHTATAMNSETLLQHRRIATS